MSEEKKTGETLPLIALRGLTIFPHMMVHFDLGREASIKALETSMTNGLQVFVVTQKDMAVEYPARGDLYNVGTVVAVRQMLHMPDGNVRIMVEGKRRARLVELTSTTPYLEGNIEEIETGTTRSSERAEAVVRTTYDLLQRYTEVAPRVAPDLMLKVLSSKDPGYIADYIAQNILLREEEKQQILEELRPLRRLEKLDRMLRREIEVLTLEQTIQERTQDAMDKNQREYYLREQIRSIEEELGEGEENEAQEYIRRIRAARLPEEVEQKLLREVSRLKKQGSGSAEGSVLRTYLDTCLELPWTTRTKDRIDIASARRMLDADHYGLDKVKERILEFLAVKQLAPELKGQVLCLVGPPGVGKTSVAMSVARAMHRKLARISLGGVHDEAEIRGHRKTYVGAMPGRIISAIRQAGSANPVLLLDEVDKLASDNHGDPSSALLEVLDGEQNSTFRDNYLELPFDLSDVLFITTANTTDTIPRPLLDRMEVIELTSYTDEEKVQIARRHLLPKQMKRHGIQKSQMRVSDDALRAVIRGYTRESGVRVLERELAALCRKTAMKLVSTDAKRISITETDLEDFLGVRRYLPDRQEKEGLVGVVNGLAWTSVGGEVLQVEAIAVPGTGKVELTGNLGEVMKESAHAALSYIRSRAGAFGIPADFHKEKDIHVHFPEGAVPKDGPSAGVAITVAMLSALTGRRVNQNVAMTGEVTLRGRVLAIGGLKEKTMAALRAGIGTVLIPAENAKDLEEIDQTVRAALRFVPMDSADTAVLYALEEPEAASAAHETAPIPPIRRTAEYSVRQ